MVMLHIGMLVLGLLIGVALAWYLQEKYREDTSEREALHEARLKQLQDEVVQADSAHAETKERLIALQLNHTELERRAAALEAELARLRHDGDAGATTMPLLTEQAAAPSASDDLTRIKGIGRVMQKKLEELGITSFRQLAELSPAEIHKINQAIEFPGRVEREHWVEQARGFLAS